MPCLCYRQLSCISHPAAVLQTLSSLDSSWAFLMHAHMHAGTGTDQMSTSGVSRTQSPLYLLRQSPSHPGAPDSARLEGQRVPESSFALRLSTESASMMQTHVFMPAQQAICQQSHHPSPTACFLKPQTGSSVNLSKSHSSWVLACVTTHHTP